MNKYKLAGLFLLAPLTTMAMQDQKTSLNNTVIPLSWKDRAKEFSVECLKVVIPTWLTYWACSHTGVLNNVNADPDGISVLLKNVGTTSENYGKTYSDTLGKVSNVGAQAFILWEIYYVATHFKQASQLGWDLTCRGIKGAYNTLRDSCIKRKIVEKDE